MKGVNDGPVRSGDVNGFERGSNARGENDFSTLGGSTTLSFLGRVGLGFSRWPKVALEEEELPGIFRVKFCGLGGVKVSSAERSFKSPSSIMFNSSLRNECGTSCDLFALCTGFAMFWRRRVSPARSEAAALGRGKSVGENGDSVGVNGDIIKGEQDLPPIICRSDSAMGVKVMLLLRLNGEDIREGGDIGEDMEDVRSNPGGGIDIFTGFYVLCDDVILVERGYKRGESSC